MSANYLIADDSMFARMLLKDAIKQIYSDPAFIEASSGQEAITAKSDANKKIDWYLLDINMGHPDGIETACKLIEMGVDNRRIALVTGNRSTDLQERADSLGLRYINKAISPNDLDPFVSRLKDFFNA